MNVTTLSRRATLVFLVVGAFAGITVYFLNDQFHSVFLPAIGISSPLGDSLGTVLIVGRLMHSGYTAAGISAFRAATSE